MNRRLAGMAIAAVILLMMGSVSRSGVTSQTLATTPAVQESARERTIVDQYCLGCHNQEAKEAGLVSGKLTLDDLDLSRIGEHAEIGEKIVRKLRSGMMPPSDSPRPDAATYEFLAGALERRLDLAAAANPTFTPPGPHRLNRREYANAIYDLLGVEVDPAAFLPVDDTSDGFDNVAAALTTSPALVESYISAAAKISRLALGHEMETAQKIYTVPSDYSQIHQVDKLSFGSRGGLQIRHYFPVDGDYAFNWTPVRSNAGGLHGTATGEKLELSVDGERLRVWNVETEAPRNASDTKFEFRVPVRAGLRTVQLSFIGRDLIPSEDYNDYFDRAFHLPGGGGGSWTFVPHVNALIITGPYDGLPSGQTASRDRIFICTPANAAEETPCARKILSNLATKAFRRPVATEGLEAVFAEYQSGRSEGDFEAGIESGLQMILSDPAFIYRIEAVPAAGTPKAEQSYGLNDLELASRLSFFLWSSIPDDELRGIAVAGRLRSAGMLEKQVQRMLADPKSAEFIKNFAGQWLQLRNLQSATRVDALFPNFDDNLRKAFRTETEMLFESIVREDKSVVDLLDADYTFVDERLAKFYGIQGVYGPRFRRVQLPPELDMRRGLLGQGSMLNVTANADRTSPVRRGKWVLINILGVIPPDPPPNVPPFKETTGGPAPATMRDRMEQHRVNPSCASCHKMMDPLGFALEAFDATGAYRTTEAGNKLDLTGSLVDGTKFNGPSELRKALLKYSPRFVETLTERLFTYALGRGVRYFDMPAVRKVAASAAKQNNRFSALVLGIVESPVFQKNQLPGGQNAE